VTPIAEISGRNFKVIQKAAEEFLTKASSISGLSILDYEINVFEKGELLIVIFQKAGLSRGFRGSPNGFPGFEVSIEASSLDIKSANFVR